MIDKFRGEYAFLSNFFAAETVYEGGLSLPTNEHYYQLCKALSLADAITALRKILDVDIEAGNFCAYYRQISPGQAKRFGRVVKLRDDWKRLDIYFMATGVMAKFWQHPKLQVKLMRTGQEPIVEGNLHHDNYWGNCRCSNCSEKPGQNKLGKILTATRSYFQGMEDVT